MRLAAASVRQRPRRRRRKRGAPIGGAVRRTRPARVAASGELLARGRRERPAPWRISSRALALFFTGKPQSERIKYNHDRLIAIRNSRNNEFSRRNLEEMSTINVESIYNAPFKNTGRMFIHPIYIFVRIYSSLIFYLVHH